MISQLATWTGSSSTEKLNSSPHMGFLEPGTIELHQHTEDQLMRPNEQGQSSYKRFYPKAYDMENIYYQHVTHLIDSVVHVLHFHFIL